MGRKKKDIGSRDLWSHAMYGSRSSSSPFYSTHKIYSLPGGTEWVVGPYRHSDAAWPRRSSVHHWLRFIKGALAILGGITIKLQINRSTLSGAQHN